MDASFIPVEIVPSKTPFGLDQLRRSYKTALSAEAAIAAAPAVGAVDEVFPFMFLMPISTPESAESATRIELVYQGFMSGTSAPDLSGPKTEYDTAVQSASASKGNNGTVLASPATLQYYAPTSQYTYFSYLTPGTTEAPDPPGTPVVITLTIGDTAYSAGSGGVAATIGIFYTLQTLATQQSVEIVPGKYWQNVARKTKGYSPWIFDVVSGPYISLFSPGNGYTAGNTLTISSGGQSATIVVDSVGSVWGGGTGIVSYHATANTFTTSHDALMATGGSGSGAGFNVFIIP